MFLSFLVLYDCILTYGYIIVNTFLIIICIFLNTISFCLNILTIIRINSINTAHIQFRSSGNAYALILTDLIDQYFNPPSSTFVHARAIDPGPIWHEIDSDRGAI